MEKLKVGILGGTGMVGQRFISLLENHPWFEVVTVAASPRSAGKTYEEAVGNRWKMATPMPDKVKKLIVKDVNDIKEVTESVDFVFSAVDMSKEEIKAIEEAYAKTGTPVVSNNSAHRWTPDVPMVVPEINPEHLEVIEAQKKRLGTDRGFIVVKPNCSIQSYAPALHALKEYKPKVVVATTYQAISGAGNHGGHLGGVVAPAREPGRRPVHVIARLLRPLAEFGRELLGQFLLLVLDGQFQGEGVTVVGHAASCRAPSRSAANHARRRVTSRPASLRPTGRTGRR